MAQPGRAGSFDDRATWTGSVIRVDGRWHMFYTGVSSREGGRRPADRAGHLRHRGAWQFFAWHHIDGEGRFFGEPSDPMPPTVHADGSLSIRTPEAHAGPRPGRS